MRLRPRKGSLKPEQKTVYDSLQKAIQLYISDIGTQPKNAFLPPKWYDLAKQVFLSLMSAEERKDESFLKDSVELSGLNLYYDASLPDHLVKFYPQSTNTNEKRKIKYFQFPLNAS